MTSSTVHNLVICTLCSCNPWPVLGLPPYWCKDPTFRARSAHEPRAVLKEFGLDTPADGRDQDLDSSAQIRWFVVPEKPVGTDGMREAELARLRLVTPEGMMGVARVRKRPAVPSCAADTQGARLMQTRFEHFALTSMLGQGDSPPRLDGKLCFAEPSERQAFGVRVRFPRPDIWTGRTSG